MKVDVPKMGGEASEQEALAVSKKLVKQIVYIIAEFQQPRLAIAAALSALIEVASEYEAERPVAEALLQGANMLLDNIALHEAPERLQ